MMKLKEIRDLATEIGWQELWHRETERRIRFKKEAGVYVDVWYTKMTVGTVLDHPTKGRGQLFRKNVDRKTLRDIFENPRVHTGKGYYGGGQGGVFKSVAKTIEQNGAAPTPEICKDCGGYGKGTVTEMFSHCQPPWTKKECESCKGSGKEKVKLGFFTFRIVVKDCGICEGKGFNWKGTFQKFRYTMVCKTCLGTSPTANDVSEK
jgi:hypothetical protein